ncbi:M48 family metalloprotease [Candidatus Micrarchaeota archaeon]|nr:M48 family metalloprotease [Candidatus Micrarchaeota archaeon]
MKSKLYTAMFVTLLVLGILLSGIFWLVMSVLRVQGNLLYIGIFVFVALMALFQWAIGPTIVKAISKAKPTDDPKLAEMVSRLAKQAGIPIPRVLLVNSPVPNAFAFGRTQKSSYIALHTGLLERLSQPEVEAVVAHELGHIKHRDILVMTMASTLPTLLFYIIYFGTLAASRDNRGNYLGAWIGGSIAQFIGTLLVLYLSRVREYYADYHSATLTRQPALLASALAKIVAVNAAAKPQPANSALRMFYLIDPSSIRGFAGVDLESVRKAESRLPEFLMTHPKTSKRITALQRMEKELS